MGQLQVSWPEPTSHIQVGLLSTAGRFGFRLQRMKILRGTADPLPRAIVMSIAALWTAQLGIDLSHTA